MRECHRGGRPGSARPTTMGVHMSWRTNEHWTFVVKNSHTGKTYIWQARDLERCVYNLLRWRNKRRYRLWHAAIDKFVVKHYRTMGPRWVASQLTEKMKWRVTRNAVIGRYNRLLKQTAELGTNNNAIDGTPRSAVNVQSKLDAHLAASDGP